MIHGDSVKHSLGLAMDLLIIGIVQLDENEKNNNERTILRATLTLLEMLTINIDRQINHEKEEPK